MQILIARDARKILSRLQPAKARDIRQAIARVAANPSAPNPNLRPLKGVPNGFRIRIGDWRVSYIHDSAAQVSDGLRLRREHTGEPDQNPLYGELDGSLSAQAIAVALEASSVGEAEDADLVVTTPAALEEMLEDAAATAAFHATRDQERVPIELVDRLLAGENPVKVWREHRGLS